MNKTLKILKWTGIVLVSLFILAEIIRLPFRLEEEKTKEQVAKIHATKLQFSDVLGENLPPDPGADADKTVPGIDANNNGIRDDVELAIFKEYPNSAKTRAVLLQYALALQMEFIQPIVNKETVTEVIREEDRASSCVSDTLVPRKSPESSRSDTDMEKIKVFINFIKKLQINTKARDQAQADFYKNLSSYNSLDIICDIDYSTLPN
ncbi:MAG: lipoprotein [Parcubacteria group bacterium Gr01-1014_24]|nr:MAG: lipoprotein [Parcubacteria group bacterium Gr01-1014_24]